MLLLWSMRKKCWNWIEKFHPKSSSKFAASQKITRQKEIGERKENSRFGSVDEQWRILSHKIFIQFNMSTNLLFLFWFEQLTNYADFKENLSGESRRKILLRFPPYVFRVQMLSEYQMKNQNKCCQTFRDSSEKLSRSHYVCNSDK